MNLSIVIPVYNEADNIVSVIEEIFSMVDNISDIKQVQMVVVDDHSSDRTYEVVDAIKDSRLMCIRLSRRSGSHTALRAGLREVTGDAVLCISGDGQDDPSVLKEMLEKYKKGASVIWALREDRRIEPWHIRKPAEIFYRLLFWLARTEYKKIDFSKADFFFLDREMVNAVNACVERNTSLFGLIAWAGFTHDSVSYKRRHRLSGRSKWSLRTRLVLARDWIIAFSGLPLMLIMLIGVAITIIGIFCALILFIMTVVGRVVSGTAIIVVAILMVCGVHTSALGVIGEYL
ncbi:MAG: glycosyltransferase family 2 protein, partial [Candidatus Omnitrophica bacterium]|nr:glycosyltransferase family 2 protein [Candidatus Omnitrophota bacterium]